MASFSDESARPAQNLSVPAVTGSALSANPPVGPPTPTMDLDTGLPWGVEGETIQAENAELREGN